MFDLDRWHEIFLTMKSNLLRTLLTAFSVAWGIFMLVLLMGAGNGFENGVKQEFAQDAASSVEINLIQTSLPFNGLQAGRYLEIKNKDLEKIKEKFKPNIELSSGVFNTWMNTSFTFVDKSGNYSLISVEPDHFKIDYKNIVLGRQLNEIDQNDKRKVVVISDKIKKELFDTVSPLNKYLYINDIAFKVIGVFKKDLTQGESGTGIIPLSTAQMLFSGSNNLNKILLSTNHKTIEEAELFEAELVSFFSKEKTFNPTDTKAIRIESGLEQSRIFNLMFFGINIFVWFISGMTLLAGIIGVSNIMLVVVKERTKEIGIRKALGAKPSSIIGLIFQESIFITAISGYIGLVFGLFLLEIIKPFVNNLPMFSNPEIKIEFAIGATIILIILGALAGLAPAIRAAKIKPIVALRDE